MKYFEFEKQISNTLKNETITFNVEKLMNDISKKKKKRGLIFLFFAIGIFAVTPPIIFHFVNLSNHASSSVENIEGQMHLKVIENKTEKKEIFISQKEVKTNADKNIQEQKKTAFLIPHSTVNHDFKSLISNEEKHLQKSKGKLNSVVKISAEPIFNGSLPVSSSANTLRYIDQLQLIRTNSNLHLKTQFNKRNFGVDNIGCPDFSNSDKSAGLEILAEMGVFKSLKSLEGNSSEVNAITELRQQNEKPLIGLQAGIYLKYNLARSPFYVFGGANYSRFTERMNLDFTTTEIDTTIGVISITESELGDTITYIYGELYTEITNTGNRTRHYSLSVIDVPFHIGYELDINRFSVGAEVGVALNISTLSSGQFLSSQSDFMDLQDQENFKQRVGMRYDTKLFAAYKIDQRQKVYLSASLNLYPNSFAAEELNTSQMYKQLGINLGYGYMF